MYPSNLTYINNDKIKSVFDFDRIVASCSSVFDDMREEKQLLSPKKLSLPLPGNSEKTMRWVNSMPAYIGRLGVAGLKWVAVCSDNVKKSLPTTTGMIILNDINTGIPFSILDAGLITHYRTAATTLLAARKFGPKNPTSLLIVGPGKEGSFTSQFLCKEFKINRIYVLARSEESFNNFQEFAFKNIKKDIEINRIFDLPSALAEVDIVIASSTSMSPLLKKSDFLNFKKADQFICGFTAFNDIDTNILEVVDNVIFDDGRYAKNRIEEVSGINIKDFNIKKSYALSNIDEIKQRGGINLYLPIGISAIDVAIAYEIYNLALDKYGSKALEIDGLDW